MANLVGNSIAEWLPLLEAAGLPVPRTVIVRASGDLLPLLDGHLPEGWDDLVGELRAAGEGLGWPCFLRTGHGSGKHDWSRTCFVSTPEALPSHVAALVEWSVIADLAGLPTDAWALREMIDTRPICRCSRYGGMPVVREFRIFVRDGSVEHVQPYWPPEAVAQGAPDSEGWKEALADMSRLEPATRSLLSSLALRANEAVGGGHWSVDFLQDRSGDWHLTDMAEGDRSFRWEPEGDLGVAATPR
jgi:hypothetical protein